MPKNKRYAMVIDARKCVGCMSCMATCKMENAVPFESFRAWVDMEERGAFPNVRRAFLPRQCNHCENAPCISACPTGASYRSDEGVVLVDGNKCIGCGYCAIACPYSARFMNSQKRIADKCNYCAERSNPDEDPACVRSCMGKARMFGDLNDPDSPVHAACTLEPVQVLNPEFGTKPQVFYIGADMSE